MATETCVVGGQNIHMVEEKVMIWTSQIAEAINGGNVVELRLSVIFGGLASAVIPRVFCVNQKS